MSLIDDINSYGLGASFTAGGHSTPQSSAVRQVAPTHATGLGAFLGGIGHSISAGVHALPSIGNAILHPIVAAGQGISENIPGVGIKAVNQKNFKQRQASLDSARQSYQQQYVNGKITQDRYKSLMTDLQKEAKTVGDAHRKEMDSYMSGGQVASNIAQTAAMALPVGDIYNAAKAAITGAKVTKAEGLAKALLSGEAKAPALREVAGKAVSVPTNAMAVQAGAAIPGEVQHGDYGGAALNAAALASPLLAKGASTLLPKAAGAIKAATVDTHGLFDTIKIAGGKTINEALTDAQAAMKPAAYNRMVNTLKVAQENILAEAGGSTKVAAAKMEKEMGAILGKRQLSEQTIQTLTKDLGDLHYSRRIANSAEGRAAIQVADKQAPEGYRALRDNEVVTVTRADNVKKAALTKDLVATAGDTQAQRGVLRQYSDVLKNRNFRAAVDNVLTQAEGDAAKIKAGMNEIRSAKAVKVAEGGPKPRNGYEYAIAPKGASTPKLPSEVGDIVQGKKAPLGFVGRAIEKAGLSPAAVDHAHVFSLLKDNFSKNLPEELSLDGEKIFNKLSDAARLKNVQDARLLRTQEIRNTLGSSFSTKDAKVVEKALRKSYGELPTAVSGLGGKVLNKVLQVPGVGKAESQYLRIEQAGRYGRYNVAFTGKQITKGALITFLQKGSFRAANPDTLAALEDAGKFNKSKLDQTVGDLLGSDDRHIGGDINQVVRPLKSMMGGMAETIAAKEGKTVREILANPKDPLYDELNHTVDTIVGYPKGGYINSPLARTLNIAIFPSRFDSKVAIAAGKAFGKMNPVAQIGTASAVIRGSEWLNSPEGEKWKKDNSELIGVLKYFTPLQTIDEVSQLLHGKGGGAGDLGSIGGLPFGVISTILTHQGVNLGPLSASQYYDPKTGQAVPTNIPITDKARVQQGFTDLLGSMFTYPGATVGLTSKTKVIQGAVSQLKPGKGETKAQLKDGSTPPKAGTQGTIKPNTGQKIPSSNAIRKTPSFTKPEIKYPARALTPKKAKRGPRPKFHAKPIPQKLS